METTVIAVDGFASTGKSTLSKHLANALNFTYIDTGFMYRVVSCFALNSNLIEDDVILEKEFEKALAETKFTWSTDSQSKEILFNGKSFGDEIRTLEISTWVSQIAQLGFVREHLVAQQRSLSKLGSVVMDGRDIGTVVFPYADFKFFLVADSKIRAQRRFDELQAKGEKVLFEEILKNVVDRDHQDSTRDISPLRKAEDALEIDTTSFGVEEVFEQMVSYINK
jgi:cytidylate kinase